MLRKQQQPLYTGVRNQDMTQLKGLAQMSAIIIKIIIIKNQLLSWTVPVSSLALRSLCVLDIRSPEPKINQQLHQYRTGTNYN